MHKLWIDTEEHKQYKGAHPWKISNNQGVEGKNKEIKQSRRLELGELVAVFANMVSEWSEEKENLLESNRLECLQGEINSLSPRTDGYQWYKLNSNSRDKIVRIKNSKQKYTVSELEKFQFGEVTNLWAVNSSAGMKTGICLKERAKERLVHRELPLAKDFDELLADQKFLLDHRDGEYVCDCPVGMKVMYMALYVLIYLKYFRANCASIVWAFCT